ncbi:hypothetical protein UFOVP247_27 [uncultured Caudovirales phage]|uniref:SprT-like n=1 Tax=uncultured Caudovirales phage TaxID=2100421 RepID=A0A6J7WRY8_9CAUD|nr:hypothetical protein UFOVP247_27 [uncultured Caudovirales phage]
MIRFYNKKHVSGETLEKCKSLGEFILDKFFTNPKKNRLDIKIRFIKGLLEKTDQFANCIWEDQHFRGEEFIIEIDPDLKINTLLNSLAHEFVHVKQWAKGEYYELQSEPKVYKFNGKRVDTRKIDYWDTPWEIEAHGRAIGLIVQWVRKNNLPYEDLTT